MPVFRCFQSDHFRTFSGLSVSRIGEVFLCECCWVDHLQSFLQAESCTTVVMVMFEFEAFPGTPLKQQYLIPEIV